MKDENHVILSTKLLFPILCSMMAKPLCTIMKVKDGVSSVHYVGLSHTKSELEDNNGFKALVVNNCVNLRRVEII